MKNSMLNTFLKCRFIYFNFLSLNREKYTITLAVLLFLSFLFSSYMIFLNYDSIFSRKMFYFYSEHDLIYDLRYLKEKKFLKGSLDSLVKDFLLGNSKGVSLKVGTRNTKLLYSFMSDHVYFINLSKEFYDSFDNGGYYDSDKLRVNLFIRSLKETINFNYPGYVRKIVIFIEGYILHDKGNDLTNSDVLFKSN
ncbi:flagellar filament outsheath protein [Candidatus Borreliella tachyglossi]|nr:flagellar filament outsheath protein [Candidatus Borreliella tachyglossi]